MSMPREQKLKKLRDALRHVGYCSIIGVDLATCGEIAEFYAAQRFDKSTDNLSFCIMSVFGTGVDDDDDDDYDAEIKRSTFTAGDITLRATNVIYDGSAKSSFAKLFKDEKIVIYEAVNTSSGTYSILANPIETLSKKFNGISDMLVPKKMLSEGGSGVVFECRDSRHVLKLNKSTGSKIQISTELRGNKTVRENIIERINSDLSEEQRAEIKRHVSDINIYEIVSDDWKKLYIAYCMDKANHPLSKDSSLFKKTWGKKIGIKHDVLKKCIRETALAISELHKKGVAHYDIKPDNIGIGSSKISVLPSKQYIESRDVTCRLIDFGTAEVTNSFRSGKRFTIEEFKQKVIEEMQKNGGETPRQMLQAFFAQARGTDEFAAPEISEFIRKDQSYHKLMKALSQLETDLKREEKEKSDSIELEEPPAKNSVDMESSGAKEAKEKVEEFSDGIEYLKKLLSIGRPADVYSFGASIVNILCNAFSVTPLTGSFGKAHYGMATLDAVIKQIREAHEEGSISDSDYSEYEELYHLLCDMLNPNSNLRPKITDIPKYRYLALGQ